MQRFQADGKNTMLATEAEVVNAAVQLLARREYSRLEIYRKLQARTADSEMLEQALDELTRRGYQSDQRCALMLARHRIEQGYGERRVRQDLQQKGIAPELSNEVLNDLATDWFERALELVRKKYGRTPAADFRERAKRVRFLAGRGFSYDELNYALDAAAEGE